MSESKNIKGFVHDLHFLRVIDRLDFDLAHGHQRIIVDVVGELAGLVEIDLVGDHEVEDVVGPLVRRLVSHTRLLQQVGLNISSGHLTHVVEPDTDELSKPGGVVVPHSLGVTEGLHDGVGLDDLVLQRGLLFLSLLQLLDGAGADEGEVGDDLLGVLSLPGPGLASNQDGLILTLWKS